MDEKGLHKMLLDQSVASLQQWFGALRSHRVDGQQLMSILDSLAIGIEIRDGEGRKVYQNRVNTTLQSARRRRSTAIARRTDQSGLPPRRQQPAGHEWVKRYENVTADGCTVIVHVDVTDLVQRNLELEAQNQRLTQQSVTDPLTGLANRRQFDAVLAHEWQRAARSGACLSLLLIDIDYFKRFNDNYGHLAGDACLRRVAAVLRSSAHRAGELVARYGGEEFVMLMPGANAADACDAAQRCLTGVVEVAIPHAASPVASCVTISIGVSTAFADPSHNATKLVEAADAAMYRAKTNGRSRMQLATDEDWEMASDTPRTAPAPLGEP